MFRTSICPSSGVFYTGCLLLRVVFSTVKNNKTLAVMYQSMLYVALCGMFVGFVIC